MEYGGSDKIRHIDDPERYRIDPVLKEHLELSLTTVDNVLTALTHTGQEGRLRDHRRERIEKLNMALSDLLLDRFTVSAVSRLLKGYARVRNAQAAVVEIRRNFMQEIDIPEIADRLNEIPESDNYTVDHPVTHAVDIQQQVVNHLHLMGSMMNSHDLSTTLRLEAIEQGIHDAVANRDITPIRFILRAIPSLLANIQVLDEEVTNMPEKNDQWKLIEAENNKLRQSLAQFI